MLGAMKRWLLGAPKDLMAPDTRRNIALIAFLAWVGLGADGLSSSCYGPEQAFRALGHYHHLALYLAFAISVTVFIIALAYNQVIRIFPNGGGGYRASTELLGPIPGVISGVALIIDYMMTIVVSVAAAIDSLFSLLPYHFQGYKLPCEILVLLILVWLNLRGVKESIKLLMPILLGFFLTHVLIIVCGIGLHGAALPSMVSQTVQETHSAFQSLGYIVVLGMFIKAYSLGASTYTGLEAVSNNVNILAEPKVRTGRLTMLYMAISLSLAAGGIILLYLLWDVQLTPGMTLNAAVFTKILGVSALGHVSLIVLLLFEAGILIIGANTGFLGGPAVLANMSVDNWLPKRFRWLSSQLVKQNGIVFFGLSALVILIVSEGNVAFLAVLYSINVFITFSLTLFGLMRYFWRYRSNNHDWRRQWVLSAVAFLICVGILLMGIITKFNLGGWLTLLLTLVGVLVCLGIRYHYRRCKRLRQYYDRHLDIEAGHALQDQTTRLDTRAMTAVFFVKELSAALHCIRWVEQTFGQLFAGYVFVSHGTVDNDHISSEQKLKRLEYKTDKIISHLEYYARSKNMPTKRYTCYGADAVEDLVRLMEKINVDCPNSLYFATRYVYPKTNLVTRALHSDIAGLLQRKLELKGIKMLTVPLLVDADSTKKTA